MCRNAIDQMWDNGIIFCVAANGTWILSVGGPNIGGDYDASQIIKTGKLDAAPGLNKWHVISITTVGQRASGIFGDDPFSNVPIRDADTGFAVFGTNQWLSAQFDDFSVSEAGNHSHPASGGEFHAGTQVGLADCAANCRVLPGQVFELRSNWQLHHVPSGLCVEADGAKASTSLTLQPCVHGKTTQQFRNDYTNIATDLSPSLWVPTRRSRKTHAGAKPW